MVEVEINKRPLPGAPGRARRSPQPVAILERTSPFDLAVTPNVISLHDPRDFPRSLEEMRPHTRVNQPTAVEIHKKY